VPVAPVRPHNHDWYQSLTMGTIYSLVVGLRCEDPRLPSPRYVAIAETCGRASLIERDLGGVGVGRVIQFIAGGMAFFLGGGGVLVCSRSSTH
jgi:hypothetical protein